MSSKSETVHDHQSSKKINEMYDKSKSKTLKPEVTAEPNESKAISTSELWTNWQNQWSSKTLDTKPGPRERT